MGKESRISTLMSVEMLTRQEKDFIIRIMGQLQANLTDPNTADNSKMVLEIIRKLQEDKK